MVIPDINITTTKGYPISVYYSTGGGDPYDDTDDDACDVDTHIHRKNNYSERVDNFYRKYCIER